MKPFEFDKQLKISAGFTTPEGYFEKSAVEILSQMKAQPKRLGFLFGGHMRDFIDAILAEIGTGSLSDEEYDGLEIQSAAYNQATYDAIAAILESREAVSTLKDKLIAYFSIKGVDVAPSATGKSNILVGAVLCD